MKISVVLAVYNDAAHVAATLDSILGQSESDFELIVVDDGSTDGTGEALAGVDARLVYHWQTNRGVPAARNAGLGLARGEIIAFLDSDDLWLPDHLETVVGALERHPEAVLAFTRWRAPSESRDESESAQLVDPLPEALIVAKVGGPSCVAVRRAPLVQVGGFDERLKALEDNDLWTRLSLLGPFSYCGRRTVVYRPAPGGLADRTWREGENLRALTFSAERVLADVERMREASERGLLGPARAAVHYARALNAIARRDVGAVRHELAEACRFMPALSEKPRLVRWRIAHTATTRSELARSLSLAARLWPDPGSETALSLRRQAFALALRSGNIRVAAELAANPGLLSRAIWGARAPRRAGLRRP
jgi:hypothetical protein